MADCAGGWVNLGSGGNNWGEIWKYVGLRRGCR